MKTSLSLAVLLASLCVLSACGRSAKEVERERERIELEKQAQRDLQKANKAIGEIGKKIGRKAPLYDLGLSPQSDKKSQPAPDQKP